MVLIAYSSVFMQIMLELEGSHKSLIIFLIHTALVIQLERI